MLTSLQFCILMEEEQSPSETVSDGDAQDSWVTNNINFYTGKEEILGYIERDEKSSRTRIPQVLLIL